METKPTLPPTNQNPVVGVPDATTKSNPTKKKPIPPLSLELFKVYSLTAYLLKHNWKSKLNIIAITENKEQKNWAKKYMNKLMILARMPKDTQLHYVHDNLMEAAEEMPRADLNILTLKSEDINMAKIRSQSDVFETSILYTLDSGMENALV